MSGGGGTTAAGRSPRARPARRGASAAVPLALLLLGGLLSAPPAGAAPGSGSAAGAPVLAQAGPGAVPLDRGERRRADELRRTAREIVGDPEPERAGTTTRSRLDDLDAGDGAPSGWWRVLLLIVAVGALLALLGARPWRRRRADREAAARGAVVATEAVAELERHAREAEGAGEHRRAVVLWFRVGVLRLRERGRLRGAGPDTSGSVARALGDDRVSALAHGHDRAAYGAAPIEAPESAAAREGWAAVLEREPGR